MLRLVKVPNALLAGMVVALLAACATHAGPVSAPLATTVPSVVAHPSYAPISAADACPTAAGVHLPDDVGPVRAAYFCARETRPVPGDGEWQFLVVKGVTSGLGPLLAVYGTPDARPSSGACDLVGFEPRLLHLHGSTTVAVRAPLDGCGKPILAAIGALDALGTVEITATRLNRVTSQLAQTSACSDSYKDMLAIEESYGGPRQVSADPRPVGSGASLCIYSVTRDPHGYRFTWLSSARQLTSRDVSRINSALAGSTMDASCSRHQHGRFALLQAGGTAGGPTTLVALDGCAVQQDGGWWRATDRLRALLTP
jgi:hypothetical protein